MSDETVNTEYNEPNNEKPDALSLFLAKHSYRVAQWMATHPSARDKLPVIKLVDGSYHWLNRAERRKK